MDLKTAREHLYGRVAYDDGHGGTGRGEIRGCNRKYVFVRYDDGQTEATPPEVLTLLAEETSGAQD